MRWGLSWAGAAGQSWCGQVRHKARSRRCSTSARNIPRVDVIRAAGLNVYDVLNHRNLVITREAVEVVTARLTPQGKRVRGVAGEEASS